MRAGGRLIDQTVASEESVSQGEVTQRLEDNVGETGKAEVG